MLLLACATPDADDTEPIDVSTDPLAALTPCTPVEPGDRLDLESQCADGVCLGDTLEEADAAYGEASFCLTIGEQLVCFWGDGVLGNVADEDLDGVPDEGARVWLLQVLDPWDGADASGLALGLGIGCFVDALGTPDSLAFTGVDGTLVASAATWNAWYLSITDIQDAAYALVPDGRVESISFQNALYE